MISLLMLMAVAGFLGYFLPIGQLNFYLASLIY